VVECTNCGLVYLNPRPTQEGMGCFYPKDYHEDRNTASFHERYEIQSQYLPDLTNQVVLDIGCARGDFLAYLKNKNSGITTIGVDFFSEKVDYDFIQFHKSEIFNCSISNESIDIVTAWAVFEHLHEPSLNFNEVSRILKKNGRFIFLVTNSESNYGKNAYTEDIPRHTYHFSEKSLDNYAKKFGFKKPVYHYETRFWDPTGNGTFYYKMMEFFGSTWEKRYLRSDTRFQRLMGKVGRKIDNIVFKNHWEAKKRSSGIIIAEFIKE
jgi:SAM-dependent methyltransferase